ncbi:ABC transporter C family member 13 [Venturia nashicola]|uniref:ABC transporter C family member 13 n=1 Tax=Venturia nashicola TaxID=86259 RepID=A0A4Z1P3C6_9PEZI|nr:ABC transporter C family member 13 [Venturia nashicola]
MYDNCKSSPKTNRLPTSSLLPNDHFSDKPSISERTNTPEFLSQPQSRQPSRLSSPFALPADGGQSIPIQSGENIEEDVWEDWNHQDNEAEEEEEVLDMPSDLRPSLDGLSQERSHHQPLLGARDGQPGAYDSPPRPTLSRKSTFHERDPIAEAKHATKKRYSYAAFFLVLSLISFAVQTETAVYIQSQLHWEKAYCMLYFTHGSWSLLWPFQLLILRLQNWSTPWPIFWQRHLEVLTQTARMVQHRTLHPSPRQSQESPWPYMFRTTVFITLSLTVAGSSWYIAVNMTTASDLTAIYNCSAFFAYAFSVPLLGEKLRVSKVVSVAVAIVGVLIVAYGGSAHTPKHGSKSGGGAGGPDHDKSDENGEHPYQFIGNVVIGVGSVMYGFYEVLYKKAACPPEDCSPGRGMIFANAVGSMIGCFTLTVLWIPLPILHFTGIEVFEFPRGEAAWMMFISVLANVTFSGSFLVLISLTSPVLSSVAALLTIFIVAIIDQLLPPPLNAPLSGAALVGGTLIIGAFIMLSWATYKEMEEERRRASVDTVSESDIDD